MTTLTIEIPKKAEKTLSDLVEQLGGKVIAFDSNAKEDEKSHAIEKLSKKEEKYLKEFEEAIEFAKKKELPSSFSDSAKRVTMIEQLEDMKEEKETDIILVNNKLEEISKQLSAMKKL